MFKDHICRDACGNVIGPGLDERRPGFPAMPFLEDYTGSGQQVQQLVLAIAGVRWPYTPDVMPPFRHR